MEIPIDEDAYPLAFSEVEKDLGESGYKPGYKGAGLLVDSLWKTSQNYMGSAQNISQQIKEELYEIALTQNLRSNSILKQLGNRHHLRPEWLSSSFGNNKKDLCYKYDATGAALIHQIYLARQYCQGRSIVRQYPKSSLEGISDYVSAHIVGTALTNEDMPFTGENILHLTILQGNREEARWLMDYYRKRSLQDLNTLLSARVTGSYFRPNGTMYYGETPLHFAVCTNDCEMFDLVLSYVSVLHNFRDLFFAPDSHGNNLVHLCVLNGLPNMYTHIKMRTQNILRQELMSAWHESQTLPRYDPRRRHYTPTPLNRCVDGDNHGGYIRKPRDIQFPPRFAESIVPLIHQVYATVRDLPAARLDISSQALVYNWLFERWALTRCADSATREHFKQWVPEHRTLEKWIYQRWEDMFNVLDDSDPLPRAETWTSELYGLDKCIIDSIKDSEQNLVDESNGADDRGLLEMLDLWMMDSWIGSRNEPMNEELQTWLMGSALELSDGAVKQLYQDRFMLTLNNNGFSPLTLSASLCNKEMLEIFVKEVSFIRWSGNTSPVVTVNLAGIEFPLPTTSANGSLYDPPVNPSIRLKGALQIICGRSPDKLQHLFQIPELSSIVKVKWDRVGKPIMLRNFSVSIIITLLLTLLCCLAQQGSIGHGDDNELRGDTYLYAFSAAVIFFVALNEFPSLLKHGWDYWGLRGGMRGIARVDKFIMTSIFVLFIISFATMIRSKANDLPTSHYHGYLASATCLSWMHNFVYFSVLQKFGPFMTKVTKILKSDVLYFCEMYIMILVGFGVALALISEPVDPEYVVQYGIFANVFVAMWELLKLTFNVTTGNESPLTVENVKDPNLRGYFGFMLMLYALLVTILLLNLLIAMMTRTYEDYGPSAEAKSLAHHYNLMVSMHRSVDPRILSQLENKYTFAMSDHHDSDEPTAAQSRQAKLRSAHSRSSERDIRRSTASTTTSSTSVSNRVNNLSMANVSFRWKDTHKEFRQYFELPLSETLNIEVAPVADEERETPKQLSHLLTQVTKLDNQQYMDIAEGCDESYKAGDLRPSRFISMSNFWIDMNDRHPKDGQVISYENIVESVWRPSNPKHVEFCFHYAKLMRQQNKKLVIQRQKRNVLLIVHPQNDFQDHIPNLDQICRDVKRNALFRAEELANRAENNRNINANIAAPVNVGDCVIICLDGVDHECVIIDIHGNNSTVNTSNSPSLEDHSPIQTATNELLYDVALDPFKGSLPVSGSCADSFRIAHMIEKNWRFFDEIIVTQVSHYKRHIANQSFWKCVDLTVRSNVCRPPFVVGEGGRIPTKDDTIRPVKFSQINFIDIRAKNWVPDVEDDNKDTVEDLSMKGLFGYCLNYFAELERNKRFVHTIWPDHCTIGSDEHDPEAREVAALACAAASSSSSASTTSLDSQHLRAELIREKTDNAHSDTCYTSKGHHIVRTIRHALGLWKRNWMDCEKVHKRITYVQTGTNLYTENYSVLNSENGDARDPLCGINSELLNTLNDASEVFVCGQTLSHCVNTSLQDIIEYCNISPEHLTLIIDGSSPVVGFKEKAEASIQSMMRIGMKTMHCFEVGSYFGPELHYALDEDKAYQC